MVSSLNTLLFDDLHENIYNGFILRLIVVENDMYAMVYYRKKFSSFCYQPNVKIIFVEGLI